MRRRRNHRRGQSWALTTIARIASATLQAWATQPRGLNGASASKISLMVPRQASESSLLEADEKPAGAGAIVGEGLEPGVDEGADQPAPHRPLVVGGVARAEIAVVAGLVVGEPGRERAETEGRHQLLAHDARARAASARARGPGAGSEMASS